MKNEIWKDIKGYEGFYKVSNKGRVKGQRVDIMKPEITICGYIRVVLCVKNKIQRYFVHRLVASAFIRPPLKNETVNHKNEIKTDNRFENLEWMSIGDNLKYSERPKIIKCVRCGKERKIIGKNGKYCKKCKIMVIKENYKRHLKKKIREVSDD